MTPAEHYTKRAIECAEKVRILRANGHTASADFVDQQRKKYERQARFERVKELEVKDATHSK